ncbi:N-acylneuraminate cytidylyltransferase [Roseivirga ehrenbergii]|uniref:CMP-N-acetylneuraminic acid synthetase n=1 Tax=Roseivirga ehrenbergii (strain DSM 102268 / JCM 13514 / KCTC 12282 / NCIMB 14502 / KMM 6017) TaxID=279360 RepID=A0A150XEE2_ROSEK|nr:pseudaminic acid cytidylyltransferase [Roseivirga ehrenbergii]KYG77044.1 CMP-N-acetylneuraminic acid synthetase [Roseivirga ehrenbergii]TCL14453.1 N-acylneuraminate cytidylyltransferase [Roseivirga ehrenbergii]
MKSLCIIPARGGSKRIPRKNIRNFYGEPVISYSIKVALKSGLFDEVMVSTDDDEIAQIALTYGAKVPFKRSQRNASDHATTMEVIEEVLEDYKRLENVNFQYVCCIYPAAPLIQDVHLKLGLEQLKSEAYTCVFPSVVFSSSIWRSYGVDDNGGLSMFWPEHRDTRTQDLKEAYHDAGQWYWFDTEKIVNWDWPNNTGTIILSEMEVQDIDNPSDWRMAEMKFDLNRNQAE